MIGHQNLSYSLLIILFSKKLDYTYPYITITLFLVANAFYLCSEFKEMPLGSNSLISTVIFTIKLFKKPRHIFMILIHWYFYAFSVIAIVAFKARPYDYFYLLFVPTPLIFFVISYKHSDPNNFKP